MTGNTMKPFPIEKVSEKVVHDLSSFALRCCGCKARSRTLFSSLSALEDRLKFLVADSTARQN